MWKRVMLVNIFENWSENCKCRKKVFDKLVDESEETVKEVKIAKITPFENENKHKSSSSTLYISLFSIIFTINARISISFTYFCWYLRKDILCVKFNTPAQTTIYETYKWGKSNKLTLKIELIIFTT